MNDFFRDLWYFLCRYVLVIFPDSVFNRINLWLSNKRFGVSYRGLNLKNPTTFTDKINFLKLSDEYYNYSYYADKLLVREFVSEKIGHQYLVPLLGVYKDADDIDFDILPEKYVLKTNHGSSWNIICDGKKNFNINYTKRKLNKWLRFNAYYLSREKQVKNIKPLIICEELLDYNINDFKFFCHNGEPFIVQVDIGRFTNHKRAFYNMTWTKQDFSFVYPIYSEYIPPPEKFEEMKEVAKKLSKQFKFSRIDLYIHQSKVYFGEITFFPEGGSGHFIPPEYDMIMGNFINL